MWNKIKRLTLTLSYLKPTQIIYRGLYTLRDKTIGNDLKELKSSRNGASLSFKPLILAPESFNNNEFNFLNKTKRFDKEIDWNFSGYGKLWCYNLNYFDFLNQTDLSTSEGFRLINHYVKHKHTLKDGLEPYPISLRNINWIKFISQKGSTQKIDSFLYNTYEHLLKNLEYHLLGNHLLENGFSLLFGAYYFYDYNLYKRAKQILIKELEEQTLNDGAHFELSPMYHQIILNRLLDCINLVSNNGWLQESLENFLTEKASAMLGFLETISFESGEIPHVNDSTDGIAADTNTLFHYARRLGIKWSPVQLDDSGYRKFKTDRYETLIDIGKIGPEYIPGHAHSDTFNFITNIDDQPVIVDTGISTYEKNAKRQLERSTESHNTVILNGREQSEIWGGFRVGRRAKVISLKEERNKVTATHDGYKSLGLIHKRTWTFGETEIGIVDDIRGSLKNLKEAIAYIHFHPAVELSKTGPDIITSSSCTFRFNGHQDIEIGKYAYCVGFNKTTEAPRLIITFRQHLKTTISID